MELFECNQMPNPTGQPPKILDALPRIFTGHHWASLGITGGHWTLRKSLVWPHGDFFVCLIAHKKRGQSGSQQSVQCQQTLVLVTVHIELTSRRCLAQGSIAPGIPHQQAAQEQELHRIALYSDGHAQQASQLQVSQLVTSSESMTTRNYDEKRR